MGGGGGGLFSGTKGGCFVAGTLILTESGWKVIEEIKTGDFVFSKNVKTGETGFKRVIETFVHMANQFVCLSCGQTLIETTLEHPFWIHQKGWKKAQFLLPSDFLTDKNNLPVSIQNVEKKIIAKEKPVYNFHVEDFCTYFVSPFSLLVHNQSNKDNNIEIPKSVERQIKKLSPKAKKGFLKAIEGLKKGDKRGLHDHPLTGSRSGQRAVDIKGLGKGRGGGRIIYEQINETIKIIEIVNIRTIAMQFYS